MSQNVPPYSWRSDWDGEAKQPGLEVKHGWVDVNQPIVEAFPPPDEEKRRRRICGLTPAIFCLVLLLILLVVGGAIGGGIGGWIATHPSATTTDAGPTTTKSAPGSTDSVTVSCAPSYEGQFNLRLINATTAIDEGPTYCDSDAKYPCVYTLISGALVDRSGGVHYIDCHDSMRSAEDPSDYCPVLKEWSVCSNGSLAVGGNALFYYCYNDEWDGKGIFNRPKGAHCYPHYLNVADV